MTQSSPSPFTPRRLAMVPVLAFCALAAWRITGWMVAEHESQVDPTQQLAWHANDPDAPLALAEQQLAAGQNVDAAASARTVLAHEPLQGRAFAILAAAVDAAGDRAGAARLYAIAERRAPRDVSTRAWLTQRDLEQGDYAAAMQQIDKLLRLAPERGPALYPVLAQLVAVPRFADALANTLRADPPWRPAMIAAFRNPKTGDPDATSAILQALQKQGGLTPDEYRSWLDSLITSGRWGEAYARWATDVPKPGGRLPLVYNGDFAGVPSGIGFDWHLPRTPGVMVQFEPVPGAPGQAAHMRFLDQMAGSGGLEQPMVLFPGNWRLSMRVRPVALDSALGLQWIIVCAGPGGVIARTDPINGSQDWTDAGVDFTVPSSGCPGQWLRLVNPVQGGAGQRVSGELWTAAVRITPRH